MPNHFKGGKYVLWTNDAWKAGYASVNTAYTAVMLDWITDPTVKAKVITFVWGKNQEKIFVYTKYHRSLRKDRKTWAIKVNEKYPY